MTEKEENKVAPLFGGEVEAPTEGPFSAEAMAARAAAESQGLAQLAATRAMADTQRAAAMAGVLQTAELSKQRMLDAGVSPEDAEKAVQRMLSAGRQFEAKIAKKAAEGAELATFAEERAKVLSGEGFTPGEVSELLHAEVRQKLGTIE